MLLAKVEQGIREEQAVALAQAQSNAENFYVLKICLNLFEI